MPNLNRAGERNLARTEGWPWHARLPFIVAARDDWNIFYAHVKRKEEHLAKVRKKPVCKCPELVGKGVEISREERRSVILCPVNSLESEPQSQPVLQVSVNEPVGKSSSISRHSRPPNKPKPLSKVSVTFNGDGSAKDSSFSKERIEALKKLDEQITKLTNAINKADEKDDFGDLYNLTQ